MKQVTFTAMWQWTCCLIAAVAVIPIMMFMIMRPPLLMSACNPVAYNSSMYQEMCTAPTDDHITLFCIVSNRCHTYFTNKSQSSMMEEEACLNLDYHMDCNWVYLQWNPEY
jgi:hypothetical protein